MVERPEGVGALLKNCLPSKKTNKTKIKALEKSPNDIETPISVSLDLQLLRQSENPEERSLADIVAAVSNLRAGLDKIDERISSSKSAIENSVIGVIMEILPRKIAKEISIDFKGIKSNRSVDPYMVRELMNILPKKASGALGILVVLSFYKEQFPWLYEIGMEAYRRANSGDWEGARQTIKVFRMMAEMSIRGPWMAEWVGGNKEAFMMMEELPFLLERYAEEAFDQQK